MAGPSRSLVWSGIAVVVIAGVWWLNDQGPDAKPLTKKTHSKADKAVDSDYTDIDFTAQFGKSKRTSRNPFVPLVAALAPGTQGAADVIDHVPSRAADGDGNWIYTGYAAADGVGMALLENTASHKAACVKTGDQWKTGRIRSISTDTVVISDPDGVTTPVVRFNPNRVKPGGGQGASPEASITPMPVGNALSGPIGPPNIQIQRIPGMRRMQVMPNGVTITTVSQ